MGVSDQSTKVRDGEQLPLVPLQSYLKQALDAEILAIEQFPSGFSNLTYLIRCDVGEFVLRRPPFGANIRSAHDMGREFRVLTELSRMGAKVPKPLVFCDEPTIMGCDFYVMERVAGVILRHRAPPGLRLDEPQMRKISTSFIDNLAHLHALPVHDSALFDLARPDGYVTRQVEGWTGRYRNAQTDSWPALEGAIAWLSINAPCEQGATLIHNDYKYDNLVLNPDDLSEIRAVLDWEMSTIGCPLMDLGTTLGYWAEATDPEGLKQYGLTSLPGNFTRQQLVDRYQETSGRSVENAVFYHVYGLFKVAGIAQQIYARYKAGITKDPRFAALGEIVRTCGEMAAKSISSDAISS